MSDSEDSNGPSANAQAKRKRVRAARACDQCYKRKVKCNCDEMPNNICSVCLNLGIDCTYLVERKKRGPKAKIQPKSNDPKTLITTILSAQKTVLIPKDESTVREMLVNIASYARNLEVQLEQALEQSIQHSLASPEPVSKSSPLSQLSEGTPEDEDHELLTLQIQSLSLDKKVHVGKSSHIMLLQTALNIRQEAGGSKDSGVIALKRSELWTRAPWHQSPPEAEDPPYDFPEPDLLHILLDAFFDKHNSIFPVLHRPSFERQVYVENLHITDRRFGAVVLVVCALASRLVDDPRTLYDESQNLHSAGWKYFKQIRLVQSSCIDPVSLYDVQLYAMTVNFVFPTPVSSIAWYVLALGLRCAQEVGVYRKANFKRPMKSRLEEELWRRVFWNMVATDLYMSIATGRPRSTREDDFDLELPPECDDDYWEIPSNPQLEFIQPPGKPSRMSYTHHLAKLLHIAGLVKDHLFTTRHSAPWLDSSQDSAEKIVMELDSALNSWMDQLPEHMKWDPHRVDDILFSQTLVSREQWVQIQLHKRFIRPGPLNTGNFPSLAICTNAARSYTHIMQAFFARPGMPMMPNFIAPTFVAAVMLLINLWISLRDKTAYDPRKDIADVYTCLEHLGVYEQKSFTRHSKDCYIRQPDASDPTTRFSQTLTPIPLTVSANNFIRQIAGSRRASQALSASSTFQGAGVSTSNFIADDSNLFQQPSAIPPSTVDPSVIFNPFYPPNVNPTEPSAFGFGPTSMPDLTPFTFDTPSGGVNAPPLDAGLDDSDFAASFASAWNNPTEDWSSFMLKVDELLHAVNSDVYYVFTPPPYSSRSASPLCTSLYPTSPLINDTGSFPKWPYGAGASIVRVDTPLGLVRQVDI
ncbi:fungal-specific transcription factor domain-containing protein [Lentinula raphanica]|nr:fungal-specific transcription factor domain-containing protein [Lentinula raphanica]